MDPDAGLFDTVALPPQPAAKRVIGIYEYRIRKVRFFMGLTGCKRPGSREERATRLKGEIP